MNLAKIQFSYGDREEGGPAGAGIYQKIKEDWTIAPEEMALVGDPGWIFSKNAIMGKVIALFAGLAEEMNTQWKQSFPLDGLPGHAPGDPVALPAAVRLPDPLSAGPKISKGENYLGLPWVMLDHPRLFGRKDVFAIRTLFWWGHYFSMTLHLKGSQKDRWLNAIRDGIPALTAGGFYICASDNEWRHELSPDNYRPLRETDPAVTDEILAQKDFLKLSAGIDLGQWNTAKPALLGLSGILLEVLSGIPVSSSPNSQAGGKDPLPGSSIAGSGL